MKKNLILYACIVTILLLLKSCENQPPKESKPLTDKLQQLSWLTGSWANISEDGEYYETWTRQNDSVYYAYSYMKISDDTVFSEDVTLVSKNGEIYYIVSVGNQNDGEAISFQLVSAAGGEFVFENKGHDFPQRIIYKNAAPDSLHARIEGIMKGEPRYEDFPMKKINPATLK